MVKSESTNHLSLKGSHSSHEPPKINGASVIKVTQVINNLKKSNVNVGDSKNRAVIPPRPVSGSRSIGGKSKSTSKKAVGNFFIS